MSAKLTPEQLSVSAQNQMAFQERMSNTAHQREVADLKAAGLNPVLSSGGNGASTPSGAEGDISNDQILKLLGESIQTTSKALSNSQQTVRDAIYAYSSASGKDKGDDSGSLTDFGQKLAGYIGEYLKYTRNGQVNVPATAQAILRGYADGDFDDLGAMVSGLYKAATGQLSPADASKIASGSEKTYFKVPKYGYTDAGDPINTKTAKWVYDNVKRWSRALNQRFSYALYGPADGIGLKESTKLNASANYNLAAKGRR